MAAAPPPKITEAETVTAKNPRFILLRVLRLPIAIAGRGIWLVRTGIAVSLVCILWSIHCLGGPLMAPLGLMVVLSVPAAVLVIYLIALHEVLRRVTGLPNRIIATGSDAIVAGTGAAQRLIATDPALRKRRVNLRELLTLRSKLRGARELMGEVRGLSQLMVITLLLCNPIALAVAAGLTAMWILIALVCGAMLLL